MCMIVKQGIERAPKDSQNGQEQRQTVKLLVHSGSQEIINSCSTNYSRCEVSKVQHSIASVDHCRFWQPCISFSALYTGLGSSEAPAGEGQR